MTQQTPLYIVASPKPRVGKTLIARLLIEYFRSGGRPLVGYDLQPRDPALASRFPDIVATVDITDTRGQMALFDRLITDNERIKVIDLGYAPFDQFFAVMAEIGFLQEARRRLIEPIMLFVTDPAATTVRAYADLRRQLPAMTFVPVHNEGTSLIFNKADFPPTRAEFGVISIPRLSAIVRGVVDRPSFSFAHYMTEQLGGPTEVHSWISTIFTEFRELELRLLMGQLTASLGNASPPPTRDLRPAR
jgi:hypothetical protein